MASSDTEENTQPNTIRPDSPILQELKENELLEFEVGGKKFTATSVLAQQMGYDSDHIGRLARQGKVESVKNGKRWFIHKPSLEEYRIKADENKRLVAAESIKVSRKGLKTLFSRRLIVPSLDLFHIAEQKDRADRVGFRSPNFDGLKPILFALFILALPLLIISRDISHSLDKDKQTAGIFTAIQDTILFLFEPLIESRNNLEYRLAEIEGNIDELRNDDTTALRIVTRETIREIVGTTNVTASYPQDIQARLLRLEELAVSDNQRFTDISTRFESTPRILYPTNIGSGGQIISTVPIPSILITDTVKPTTLTVLGSGTVAGSFTISGQVSASQYFGANLIDCDQAGDTLNWDSATGNFSCGTDSGAGATEFVTEEGGSTILATTNTLNFEAGMFALSSSGSSETIIRLDWGTGGPASLSQNETVTGLWTFFNGASVSTNFEVSGTASVSQLVIGGSVFSGRGVTSNSLNFDELSNTLVVDANTTISLTSGTLQIGNTTFTTTGTSTSVPFESTSYASSSQLFGSGLSSCNATTGKLTWTNGIFGCGTDFNTGGGGGTQIELGTVIDSGTLVSSVSFDAGMFDVTFPAGGLVKLDWTTGPASLSQNETVTGIWTFSGGASVSNLEVTDTTGISASISNTFYVDATNTRIGIGTSGPAGQLHVLSAISDNSIFAITDNLDTDNVFLPILEFKYNSGTTIGRIGGVQINGTDTYSIRGSTTRPLSLSANGGDHTVSDLFISTSGDVGIRTITPTVRFELLGAASISDELNLGGVLNAGLPSGTASVAYNRFGTGTVTAPESGWITDSSDVFVSGDLYGVGSLAFQGPASLSNTLWVATGGNIGRAQIHAPVGSDASFYLSDDDVAHGVTDDFPTNVFGGLFTKSSTEGGLAIKGIEETGGGTGSAVEITAITGAGNSGDGAFEIITAEKSGTGGGALEDNELSFVLQNTTTDIFKIFGSGNASSSGDWELTSGYASVSSGYFGSGLQTCDPTSGKLTWTNGIFACGTDQSGGGGGTQIELGTVIDSGTLVSSVSFDAGMFDVTTPAGGLVKLDWTNGPASLSQNETVTGIWTFSGGASISNLEVTDTTGISASISNTFYVDGTNQRVGIGTSAPGGRLDVYGPTSNVSTFRISDDLSTNDVFLPILEFKFSDNSTIGRIGGVQINGTDTFRITGAATRPISLSGNNDDPSDLFISTAGMVGINTITPTVRFELLGAASISDELNLGGVLNAGLTGGTASVAYNRFGGTTTGVPTNYITDSTDVFIAGDLDVSATASFAIASASSGYFGSGLADCDNPTTSKLLWSDTGFFSCGTDTSGGGTQIELGTVIDNGTLVSSISFDAGMFDVTTPAGGLVKLDWTNGPASRAANETITGLWEFRNGASFTADIDIFDNTGTKFAIFSSTSTGRFGLGDTTPEAFFEIASGSGVTASISNIFSVNPTSDEVYIDAMLTTRYKATNTKNIAFQSTNNTLQAFIAAIGDGQFNIQTSNQSGTDPTIYFRNTDSVSNLAIQPGGNVGIRVDSPTVRLEVGGTASASRGVFTNALNAGLGNVATVAYNRFGTGTVTAPESNWITDSSDVFVSGDLYGVGSLAFQGPASLSNTLWVDSTNKRVGIGTTNFPDGSNIAISSTDGSPLVSIVGTQGTLDFCPDTGCVGQTRLQYNQTNTEFSILGPTYITMTPLGGQVPTSFLLSTTGLMLDANATVAAARFPTVRLEVGGTASASRGVFTNALNAGLGSVATVAYNRFGTGTATAPESVWINDASDVFISDSLYVTSSISANIASISNFRLKDSSTGLGMVDCDSETQALGWDITSGRFYCGTDGGGSSRFEVGAGTATTWVSSISFEAGDFDFSNTGSASVIGLDWTNGPASRSANETITGLWEFRNGASFAANVYFTDNTAGRFAVFSSASLGRFGLGDTTPEAFFEIASSSGITASISNTFYVDGTNKRVGINVTAPEEALEILGVINSRNNSGANIRFYNTNGAITSTLISSLTSTDFQSSNNSGQDTSFRFLNTAGKTNFSIEPSGFVEIAGAASISGELNLYGVLNAGLTGGTASVAYNRFGTGTTGYSGFISTANDLLLSGDFEVDGQSFFDNHASISGSLEITRNGTTGSHLILSDSSLSTPNNYFALNVNDGDFQIRHASVSSQLRSEELIAFSISSKSLATTIGTPASPSYKGFWSSGSITGWSVKVVGQYAYLANGDSGLRIISISDPGNPVLRGTYDSPGSAMAVEVVGKYAYLADSTAGLQIIDISDPSNPVRVGGVDTDDAKNISISGRYAYVADDTGGIKIIDIANPRNPVIIISKKIETGNPSAIEVVGNYAYVANGSCGGCLFRVLDVSNPYNPRLVSTLNTSTGGMQVVGRYAYTSDGSGGVTIIDISTPTAPVSVGTTPALGLHGFYVDGRYMYIANFNQPFAIIDISNPANPQVVVTLNLVGNNRHRSLFVAGGYAYIANDDGLAIVDVGGVNIHTLLAGDIGTSFLDVSGDANVSQRLNVGSDLIIGTGGILSNGPITINSSHSYSSTLASAGFNALFEVTQDKGYYAGDTMRLEMAASTSQEYFTGNFLRFTRGPSTSANTALLVEANGSVLSSGGFRFGANGAPSSASYNWIGATNTDVPTNYISNFNDLYIAGDLDVSATASFAIASASSGYFGSGLQTCNATTGKLTWANGIFACGTDQAGSGGGATPITVHLTDNSTRLSGQVSMSFDYHNFTLTASGGGDAVIGINWTTGPASRTADQTITGFWNFANNVSISSNKNFEVSGGYASASAYKGGGLTDCDDANQVIQWTASGSNAGKFGCTRGFGIQSVQVFDADGTWVKPAGVATVSVEVWGGGGSGANGATNVNGGGGGGGGYSAGLVGVTGNVTVAVGAATQNSSFAGASATITGGGGTTGSGATGSAGGSGTGGTINISGGTGGDASGTAGVAGAGGGSPLGGAGGPGAHGTASSNTNGEAGVVPGGGGGGGHEDTGTGGSGAAGRVIVWAYYGSVGGKKLADYAEWYETETNVDFGEIVAYGDDTLVYQAQTGVHAMPILRKAIAGDKIFGVVSTAPESIIGNDIIETAKNPRPIALSGRVPVKVSTLNGPIKKGDLLTASGVPGVAVRTDKAGQIIGSAMEDYNGPADQIGKVLVFINTGYTTGAKLKSVMLSNGIDIGEVPYNVDVGRIILAQMLSEKKNIAKETSFSEVFTDRAVAGLEMIAPRILSDTLVVDSIEPVDKNISLKLSNGGKFEILGIASGSFSSTFSKSASGSPVITFDSLGNASFAGEITATKLNVPIPGLEVIDSEISILKEGLASINSALAVQASVSKNIDLRLAGLESQMEVNLKDLFAIEGGLEVQGMTTLNGGLEVGEIRSLDEYIAFATDTVFFGRPIFNADTGGFAVIHKGRQRVDVDFEKDYLEMPVVNVTMRSDIASLSADELFSQNIKYVVEQKDTGGFSIVIDGPAQRDLSFGWTAIAIKNPKTFFSEKTPVVEESTPEPTPEVIINEPQPATSPEPTVTPEPTAIPLEVSPAPEGAGPDGISGEATSNGTSPTTNPEPTLEPTPNETSLTTSPELTVEPTPSPVEEVIIPEETLTLPLE